MAKKGTEEFKFRVGGKLGVTIGVDVYGAVKQSPTGEGAAIYSQGTTGRMKEYDDL